MARPATNESPAARRGRTLGLATFFTLVTAFTAICAVQIIQQTWAPTTGEGPAGCETGLRDLTAAMDRARSGVSSVSGEQPSLAAFRKGLLPEWGASAAIMAACQASPANAAWADEVLRLRYAEERAIRYEAPELAELRRSVRTRSGPLEPNPESPPGQ